MDSKETCSNCNEEMIAEGVHIEIGYIYPPFHCDNCGWSEKCDL